MSLQHPNKAKANTKDHLYDVFLCHNGSDKDMVELIARRLEDEANLRPFLDKWHLVPGEPWQEDLEEALNASLTCAVFVGTDGVGPWENEEMRTALNERVLGKSLRVIPVLLPGAELTNKRTLPRFLERYTWVDFRGGFQSPEAFQRLVAGIEGRSPGRASSNQGGDASNEPATAKWEIVLKGSVDDVDKALIENITNQLREFSGDVSLTIKRVRRGSIILEIESSELALDRIRALFRKGKLQHVEGMNIVAVDDYTGNREDAGDTVAQQAPLNEGAHGPTMSDDDRALWEPILQEIASFGHVGQEELAKIKPHDLIVVFQESQATDEIAGELLQSPRIIDEWPSQIASAFVKWAHRHRSAREGGQTISYLAEHILRSYELSRNLPTKKEGSGQAH